MSITFSPSRVACVIRLIGQSNVQSRMMLVGLHWRRGLSSGDHIRNAFEAASPSAVYCGLAAGGLRARICSIVISPFAYASRTLFGTMSPRPPLGGTVSTPCSMAQSPVMFGSPDGNVAARGGGFGAFELVN